MNSSIRQEGIGMTSLRTRERLVQRLIDQGIQQIAVLEAIRTTPRHLFIEEALAHRAYEDVSLPIGFDQTISQPYIVARMTEIVLSALTKAKKEDKAHVLELGTGCGYQTTILAQLVKRVYSIERISPLLQKTKERLSQLAINNIQLKCADGRYGWPQHAPFDAIITTAAAAEIPKALIEQLAEGGVIVIPVGDSRKQELQICRKLNGEMEVESVEPVVFVPLLEGVER
ncbi:protein-L-isoaspartate(D-aspartate) O-methyltransferase [Haliea sp. AH-315-K21]|uniref:Protein-L-isoaspartate O-methyltransferase n=1 Tax=SAR86 cluster bacterium TaxID=2030880 RepID=A0A2A5C959_9GAMM|nr:protein-L-isoaspartate(D-aspartate) O-methyltransferase [Haliea sp. AH-315-K21]PCJ40409.1 MAG: protein-L-isoaspartate O-methyltransferase [SAR86 cluster bacterium]